MSSVYKLRRGGQTVYIGRTDRDVEVRASEHRKSGKEFSYYIVHYDDLTHEESVRLERELLRRTRTRYNR